MTTLIAWGNIKENYPFQQIPSSLATQQRQPALNSNRLVQKRYHSHCVAHFLLWELCKIAKISTALLASIYRTSSGRPQFPMEHIDFNISHSGDWVAVILNINERGQSAVGIDIEHPQKKRNFTALLQYFSSPQEQDWFRQQSDSASAFYRIWCLREALLKSQGVGIVKLREVSHNPYLNLLYSDYCPQGKLIFSNVLPFYLAVFAGANELENRQCFQWSEGALVPYKLNKVVNYSVNF